MKPRMRQVYMGDHLEYMWRVKCPVAVGYGFTQEQACAAWRFNYVAAVFKTVSVSGAK